MSASPAEIAKRLTKAQRKALLAMPSGWVHWWHIPDDVDEAFLADDQHKLLHLSEGTAHVMLSPLGLLVRAELEKEGKA